MTHGFADDDIASIYAAEAASIEMMLALAEIEEMAAPDDLEHRRLLLRERLEATYLDILQI